MDKRYYVYAHRRADDGSVFYIGSGGETVTPNPSKGYARARSGRAVRRGRYWARVVDQAGGFSYEILGEYATDLDARKAEIEFIKSFELHDLVNVRRQVIVWEEIRRSRHGRRGPEHPNYGKRLSAETCKKKSDAIKGEKHHLYGKRLPDDWRRNIAKSKMGAKNPMSGRTGGNHPSARSIINRKTSVVYGSISEAAQKEGYKMKTLANWLSGFRKNPTPLRYLDGL